MLFFLHNSLILPPSEKTIIFAFNLIALSKIAIDSIVFPETLVMITIDFEFTVFGK